jgi:hypothetical protein
VRMSVSEKVASDPTFHFKGGDASENTSWENISHRWPCVKNMPEKEVAF